MRYGDDAILYTCSTKRWSPTICAKRAYAQLIDNHVCSSSVVSGLLTPFVMTKGSDGRSGLGNVQGNVPSIRSVASTPASSAAARTKNLMLDPVWRRRKARLTSLCPATNPGPPTIARIAPVAVSSDITDAWIPALLTGSCAIAASSADT